MSTGHPPETAVAEGGPVDGTVLGRAGPDRYEVRMADATRHVYVRSGRTTAGRRVYEHTGRR